jgi:alanine-synthesizing transaminase
VRFSSRLPSDLTPNELARIAEAKRCAGTPLIDLTLSNPTRAGFSYDQQAVLGALAKEPLLDYDPGPHGLPAARRAIAEYYRDQGIRIDPQSVFPTASTSEAYSLLFKLLTNADDCILAPRPSYPLIQVLAELEAVRTIPYRIRRSRSGGWELDLEDLARQSDGGCRAIAAVSPNNPTGSFLKPAERQMLSQLAHERDIALIVDEVFLDYPSAPPTMASPLSAAGNEEALTFVLSGLSKIAGLPQIKLSWIVASGSVGDCAQAVQRLEFIADNYLSASSPAQIALPELLRGRAAIQDQIRKRLAANEALIRDGLKAVPGVEVPPREGGWYVLVQFDRPGDDEELARALLVQDNVLVQPGFFYDFSGGKYLVLSLLTPEEEFERGIARVRQRLGGPGTSGSQPAKNR